MSDAIEAACREFILHQDTIPLRIGRRSVELWGDYAPAITAAITAYEAAKGGGVGVKPLEPVARQIIHELAADIRDRLSHEEGSANWRNAQRIVELSRPVAAITFPASGERDAVIEEDGFIADDFAEVYRILRDEGTTHAALKAALSNNLNVIIAALARASAGGSA